MRSRCSSPGASHSDHCVSLQLELTRQVLWTDKDNARLVARYPEVEATYKKLKNGIQRADFVRNLYMWEFGG